MTQNRVGYSYLNKENTKKVKNKSIYSCVTEILVSFNDV